MGNNASAAVDELSDELAALLDATSITSTSTRDELYSFFDDGFDDDAEEIPGASGARTPAPTETFPEGYFALPIHPSNSKPALFSPSRQMMNSLGASSQMKMTSWKECQQYSRVPDMVDEGYCSSESSDLEMDIGDEEEKEALLPAKRFSWRASSPERCSLLYWEK